MDFLTKQQTGIKGKGGREKDSTGRPASRGRTKLSSVREKLKETNISRKRKKGLGPLPKRNRESIGSLW